MKPKKELLSTSMFIKHLRNELNFTQSDVAVNLGIEQSAYQRKEAGITRFKREELVLLAELFKTPIWEFFWQESDQEAFVEFTRQKGFIPKESYKKELESLSSEVQSLKNELDYIRERNKKLEEDKEFLRSLFQQNEKIKTYKGKN